MVDYEGYMKTYCQKNEKTSSQHALDTTDIYLEIDTDMNLYPTKWVKGRRKPRTQFFFAPKTTPGAQ